MQRSWLVWATSTAAFALTAIIIALTGTSQEPAQGNPDSRASYSLGSAAKFNGQGLNNNSPNNRFGFEKSAVFSGRGSSTKAVTDYRPPEKLTLAHPSNYGERLSVDANGNPLNNTHIVVLHETVSSAASALNTFLRNNPNDNDQVSYHTLIGLDGTVYYIVPPEQRAYGAGNSTFRTGSGEESVFTNPEFPSSVNNFAYHVAFETPPDGYNNNAGHSGYTDAQYRSLAWLLSRSTVPNHRITTHKAVDRSGSRSDPRSFEPQRLLELLDQYPSRAGLQ